MDPWKLEEPAAGEVGFHLVRLALFASGVGAWLLAEPRPGVAAPLALAACLTADAAAHATGVPVARAAGASLAAAAALWAVAAAGAPALVAAVAAVALGAPSSLGRPWSWAWCLAVLAGGALAAGRAGGVPAALHAAGALAAAAWFGHLHAEHQAERRRLQEAVEELTAAQTRLAALAEQARALAAERERQRILGALHDALGHALTAQLLQVQVARRLLARDPAAADARLAAVEEGLREGLAQVRQALRRSLHPGRLPLASALQLLAEDLAAAGGPRVELAFAPDAAAVSDVDAEVAEVLYRAVQEALTNAVRHGRARYVQVRLEASGPRLRLIVRDDGAGAADFAPGMGLSGMAARVQRVGGSIRFRTAPGEGFRVEIGVRRR